MKTKLKLDSNHTQKNQQKIVKNILENAFENVQKKLLLEALQIAFEVTDLTEGWQWMQLEL